VICVPTGYPSALRHPHSGFTLFTTLFHEHNYHDSTRHHARESGLVELQPHALRLFTQRPPFKTISHALTARSRPSSACRVRYIPRIDALAPKPTSSSPSFIVLSLPRSLESVGYRPSLSHYGQPWPLFVSSSHFFCCAYSLFLVPHALTCGGGL
jgi:hypothetical protein